MVFTARAHLTRESGVVVRSRMFAIGPANHAAATLAETQVERRLAQVVDDVDTNITEVRCTIFGLRAAPGDEE